MNDNVQNSSVPTSNDKRTLLAELLRQRRTPLDKYPASYAQERLWFIDQIAADGAAYHMAAAVQLRGALNEMALRQAWAALVRRHEAFRTHFTAVGGRPWQVVSAVAGGELEVTDLGELATSARAAAAVRVAAAEARRPFDLAAGPLWRARLLRLSAVEHELVVVLHHIIADGWSVGIVLRELGELYGRYARGEQVAERESELRYVDYARWQREWMKSEAMQQQLHYWQGQLSGVRGLELPVDRRRGGSGRSGRGGRERLELSAAVSAGLRQLGRKEGATLYMVLLAAFKVLLSKYSGQVDIAVGTPVAGRGKRGLEAVVGVMLNTLVLRSEVRGTASFTELLRQEREVALAAYAHQELPFERIVEELQPERDLSQSPLFQVAFDFQSDPVAAVKFDHLEFTAGEIETGTAKFDLSLSITERDRRLIGTWEYSTDLFDSSTIHGLVRHFEILIDSILANPETPVWKLSIVTAADRRLVLEDWNQTDAPRELSCVHELFQWHARNRPGATAIVQGIERISYSELNSRANQLAHFLREQGVDRESVVAVLMNRSIDLIVAVLGILKSGGVYLPLDPASPKQRLEYMLDEARTQVLITEAVLAEKVDRRHWNVLIFDVLSSELDQQSLHNPDLEVTPDNLAYAIYTSGSTGLPKGVLLPQRGLANLVNWHRQAYAVSRTDRGSLIASLAFDASVWEIWPYLASGASLAIPNEDVRMEIPRLLEWLRTNEVSHCFLPTPLAEVALPQWADKKPLRYLLTGGDRLRDVGQHDLGLRLINHYGPTEATVVATATEVEPSRQGEQAFPPIGRPIANVRAYILDEYLEPVAPRITGEIYIAGDGLARGYLNQPQLTAERFVPNPYSKKPGERMYRTGDRGRFLPDGRIDYVGRIDQQIKIRGNRVEPGEIETVIKQQPYVRDTAVLVQEVAGQQSLTAFLVEDDHAQIDTGELKTSLRTKLPDYMIPSQFIKVRTIPLRINGKVDREALLSLTKEVETSHNDKVGPRNAIEEQVLAVWEEVLKVAGAGIHDDFFELGGHSLLAIQMAARISDVFQSEVPVRSFFEQRTVARLSETIEATLKGCPPEIGPPLERTHGDGEFVLSYAQERLWFIDQIAADGAAYHMAAAVQLRGALNEMALRQAWAALVRRHEAFRTHFTAVGGRPWQVVSAVAGGELEVTDLGELATSARAAAAVRVAAAEARRPFDLAAGPLWRARLLRLSAVEHELVVVLHHIIADGWSVGIVLRELGELYGRYARGEQVAERESELRYVDYARWQREWMKSEAMQQQLHYWQGQLSGVRGLELPVDRRRGGSGRSGRGGRERLELSAAVSAGLRQLGRKEGATLYMVLLAAFKVLLSKYSGQVDIAVGTPVAGRGKRGLEAVVGVMLNTLVLRSEVRGTASFTELLRQEREVALAAYAHQELPFERIVEELQPERDLSQSPLFQVFINMIDLNATQLDLFGLEVDFRPIEETGAKFDLSLYITEKPPTISLELVYDADLFEKPTIIMMLRCFENLLRAILINPEAVMSSLSLLSQTSPPASDSLSQPGPTNAFEFFSKADIEQSICSRFNYSVRKSPNQIAVITKRRRMTYAELDHDANGIAGRLLKTLGTGPARVALLLNHDASMFAAILGALKANKTYVPLDPSQPTARLKYILEDSQATVLVTNDRLLTLASQLSGGTVNVLSVDQVPADPSEAAVKVSPNSVAYILYTSGSTGKPKGVMQSHRNVLHFIKEYTNKLHIASTDRLTLLSSYGFDAAVMDIFGALLNGATLCSMNVKEEGFSWIVKSMKEWGVTIYHSTPTVYRHLIGLLEDRQLPSVRLVVLGGEEAYLSDFELFKKHFPSQALFVNGLGPTESTVSLQFFMDAQTKLTRTGIPVGYPVEDTKVLLLDEQGHDGAVYGEIAIESPYVSRYWHDREETGDLFSSSDHTQPHHHHTGDMGRILPDGSIQYMGRKDFQIKIRGHRIEPAEVEEVLKQHSSVRECLVISHNDRLGEKRLIAYVESNESSEMQVDELRSFVRERLPEYMTPAAFIKIESLPLTANGKVDHNLLLKLSPPAIELRSEYVEPRSDTEKAICQIWQDVLQVEKVGCLDVFFDLGGHSLLMIQVQDRLRQTFGRDVPLIDLFKNPTVISLAKYLTEETSAIRPFEEVEARAFTRREKRIHKQESLQLTKHE